MYTMTLYCTQRTIHIQLYSVDQSREPVAEPYKMEGNLRRAEVGAEVQARPQLESTPGFKKFKLMMIKTCFQLEPGFSELAPLHRGSQGKVRDQDQGHECQGGGGGASLTLDLKAPPPGFDPKF